MVSLLIVVAPTLCVRAFACVCVFRLGMLAPCLVV